MDEFYAEADRLFRAGDVDGLEAYLLDYERQLAEGDPARVAVLNEIAGFYRGVSRYEESAEYFERALRLLPTEGDGAQLYARVKLNLAGLYRYMGRLDLAEEAFLQVRDLMDRQGRPDPYAYVSATNGLALTYQSQGRYDEALVELQNALTSLQGIEGAGDHEVGTTLVNMANAYIQKGEVAPAREQAEKAVSLFEAMPQKSSHLSSAYSVLATALFQQGDVGGARAAYEKAAELSHYFFGKNADYAVVKYNLAQVCEAEGDLKAACEHAGEARAAVEAQLGADDAKSRVYRDYHLKLQRAQLEADGNVQGLELVERYFNEVAFPSLCKNHPELITIVAAGLVGNGSECLGFDDALSRDHDWGIDFFVWLPDGASDEMLAKVDAWKAELFATNPPLYLREQSAYGSFVKAMRIGDFYRSLLGVPDVPDDIAGWLRIPQENLLLATNGKVFVDNLGEFTRRRKAFLQFYPDDLRKKRISTACMYVAQTGQYNYGRMAARGDWASVSIVQSQFVRRTIELVYLLNKRYRPYYKWVFPYMLRLPILGGEVGQLLDKLMQVAPRSETDATAAQAIIDEICRLLADELRRQQLCTSDDEFLATHGEQIRQSIEDSFLRGLPAQYEA